MWPSQPRLQPRSLFIGVAHTAELSPAWCRLVPARLWEQPLTQEKNNGGIVQKIRSSPGLTLVLCAAHLVQGPDIWFVNLLNRKTHHDASPKNSLRHGCLSPNSKFHADLRPRNYSSAHPHWPADHTSIRPCVCIGTSATSRAVLAPAGCTSAKCLMMCRRCGVGLKLFTCVASALLRAPHQ